MQQPATYAETIIGDCPNRLQKSANMFHTKHQHARSYSISCVAHMLHCHFVSKVFILHFTTVQCVLIM